MEGRRAIIMWVLAYLPFLSFWLTPVSENERVCPRDPRPGPLWPSEKDEHLGGGGAREPLCRDWSWVSPCSLLGLELRESRRLRCPRFPIARYSGPSSYSPSPESPASGWSEVGEGDSVRAMQGTETGSGEGVTPCSISPGLDTHTQGAPRLLAGEVVSATEEVNKVRWIETQAFTTTCLPPKIKLTGLLLCHLLKLCWYGIDKG